MNRILFAALLFLPAPATAQETRPALDLIGEIELVSDHRHRGVSRSDEDPTLRGALTLFHDSGLYAGGRGTILRGIDPYRGRDLGDVQADLYAGWRGAVGGGLELEAGGSYSLFEGGQGGSDYGELNAALAYQLGPANLSAGARYAPAQGGTGGRDMTYLYGRAAVAVPFRPWSFAAELGRQQSAAFGDYWTWSLGARRQLPAGWLPDAEIGLDYVDTDLADAPGRDAGLVLSLRLGF
ncbi:MAG: TorF family putative porin [Sphingomonas sp.]